MCDDLTRKAVAYEAHFDRLSPDGTGKQWTEGLVPYATELRKISSYAGALVYQVICQMYQRPVILYGTELENPVVYDFAIKEKMAKPKGKGKAFNPTPIRLW